MEKREARRDRDWRHAVRAQREHLRVVHSNGEVDCICERSAWFFRKRKALGRHDCRRRDAGNPKLARGWCWRDNDYRPAVRQRIDGTRLCRAWATWVGGADDCEL